MTGSLRISVLDQTPVLEGSTPAQALHDTVDLAEHAERLGFHRYWLAEHHGGGLVAGPSPEVLIARLGAATREIRLGSGGVMLPHYSPLKVAESFGVLAGLFPGRIDLGIGRAPGSDRITMQALQRDPSHGVPDDFPEQLAELIGYLDRSFPADNFLARLADNLPGAPETADLWLLGSSEQSAYWAGELGLPYAFADFIHPHSGALAEMYRESFQPSARLAEPKVIVGVRALLAETQEEAEHLSTSWRMAFDLMRQGRQSPVPPPEKAARYLELHKGGLIGPARAAGPMTGTAARVREEIEATAASYGAEEVIVVTITHDHAARRRSYELLADVFELEPRARSEPAALRAAAEPAAATAAST